VRDRFLLFALAVWSAAGCLLGCGGSASEKRDARSAGETLYVEGKVSLRGSRPFPLLLLESSDGKIYLIDPSPLSQELEQLQEMSVGVRGRMLPEVKMDVPTLSIASYEMLPLSTGQKPLVGTILQATAEGVTMRAQDDSIWRLEGDFKSVFLGLQGAKVWVIGEGDAPSSPNARRDSPRTILVTEYGIIREAE